MKLSPIYVKFMAQMVGLSMTKAMFFQLDTREQTMLLAIAIHQATCPEDSVEIMLQLQNYGKFIHDFWDTYVFSVREHNKSGCANVTLNVNEMMERMKNDPTTQRSSGL